MDAMTEGDLRAIIDTCWLNYCDAKRRGDKAGMARYCRLSNSAERELTRLMAQRGHVGAVSMERTRVERGLV
jgi:hypothetical protein